MLEQLLPWHEAAWKRLVGTIEQNRVPQALIITGPAGLGKRVLAQRYAAEVLCYQRTERGMCHHCDSCHLMAEGHHIDCLLVEAEADAQAISIEQVRSMSARIYQSSAVASHKVAIMIDADKMQDKAANALLKTLEEPPTNTTIVLLATKPAQLPATIKSRCQVISIMPPDLATLTDTIQQQHSVSVQEVGRAYTYAMGSPAATEAAIEDNAYQAVITEIIQVYVQKQSCIESLIACLKTTSIEQILYLSLRLVMDLIGYKLQGMDYPALLLPYEVAVSSGGMKREIYRLYKLYDAHMALFAEFASGIVWQSNAMLMSVQYEWEQTLEV